MLTLNNITKNYKVGKKVQKVLNGISLNFENNGFVSILGPSGCGKTTLLNIIGGLDKPTSGEVFINGHNMHELKSRELDAYRNSTVGFIFQSVNLIEHLNVYQNVELALQLNGIKRKERRKKVIGALNKVRLGDMIHKKPSQLSGGEQQRVAIARAIVNNPIIILADEPTGSLDSKTADEIINIMKELSLNYLVIMVTHNERIASDYSNRIIRLLDGNVVYDKESKENIKIEKNLKIKKVKLPILMSFSLSIRNLCRKWMRTILTSFAGSIGIIGVALVLAVSSGVKEYISEVQTNALKDYPIVIRSSTVISTEGSVYSNRIEFPETSTLLVTNSLTNYEHISNLDQDLVNYVNELEEDKYTIINYNRTVNMKLLKKNDTTISTIYLSYFNEMMNNNEFMNTQYDIIYGEMPDEYNELALVVDSYNSISASILSGIGLDYSKESYDFSEIIGTTYKLIHNDSLYLYNEENDRFSMKGSSYNSELYNDPLSEDLVITAILRENENCSYPLYSTGILYTTDLTEKVVERANESKIVIQQKLYGTTRDVMTGQPYQESSGLTFKQSIEYQYENDLIYYGAEAQITRINIYSQSFENRNYIESYIKDSSQYNSTKNISYYDYMSTVSKEFSTFIEILTRALVIFAMISLLVSAIMISIITYISVLERSKEIGLLRSIGARKIDITQVFCAETSIVGLLSGLLGILLSFVLKYPINGIIENIIKNNLPLYSSTTKIEFVRFDSIIMMLLVIGSIVITIIAGLIPSIIASFKQPAKVLKGE